MLKFRAYIYINFLRSPQLFRRGKSGKRGKSLKFDLVTPIVQINSMPYVIVLICN